MVRVQKLFYRATLCVTARSSLSSDMSVRLSVCHVRVYQTAEDIVKHLSQPGSPMILVFLTTGADTQFQGEPLRLGAQNTRRWENLRFSTVI